MLVKTRTKIALSIAVIGMTLIGCGSSNSNDTTKNAATTGYFIDAAVQGAHYKTTSGIEGDTDQYGKFSYNLGDTVEFSLGKLILGASTPGTDGLITPKTLIAGDGVPDINETASITLLLRTLQSLDSDGNTSNGITISSTVIDNLATLGSDIDFETEVNEAYLIDLDNNLTLGLDEDYDGRLDVNETEATNHAIESENEWSRNNRPENHGNGNGHTNGNHGGTIFDINNYALTPNISVDIKKSLAYMGNEERLAYDIYNALGTTFSDVKQFKNIATKSEIKHIQAVQTLIQRYEINGTELSDGNFTTLNYQNSDISAMTPGVYGVTSVQDLYNTLISEGTLSKIDALKVGCKVEVVDVDDLDKYITQAADANASDVEATFEVLRAGSYKHYWAFDKALKSEGVTNGCNLGSEPFTDKAGVYPN